MAAGLGVIKHLLDALPSPSVLLGPDLKPLHVNTAFLAMMGLRTRSLAQRLRRGATLFDLIGRYRDLDEATARECMRTGVPTTLAEVRITDAKGEWLTVSMTFAPVGVTEGIVLSFHDYSAEATVHERYKALLDRERHRALELEHQVQERTQELSEALKQVTVLSRIDPLTGLLNRRAFAERAEQALALARRYNRSPALLVCDLDHFKRVNDKHGHPAGDAVLAAVAAGMRGLFRNSDAVGRFGGEEFVVLLAETESESVLDTAKRCVRMVKNLPIGDHVAGATFHQTISIGFSLFPQHGETLDELFRHADRALYFAKDQGRDRAISFDEVLMAEGGGEPGPARVLLVDEDQARLESLEGALRDSYDVRRATTESGALSSLRSQHFDAIVADESVAPDGGVALMTECRKMRPSSLRVLVVDEEAHYVRRVKKDAAKLHYLLVRNSYPAHVAAAVKEGLAERAKDLAGFMDRSALHSTHELSAASIEQLLQRTNMQFAYQPILNARESSLFGYEALLRPRLGGMQSPLMLVEAAERSDNIWRLGRLVREVATAPLEGLPRDVTLFVNMHPDELDDPTLFDDDLPLGRYAERIVFELTERTSIHDYAALTARVRRLQERGYRFAIDDVGSGYSSLNALAAVEADFLKLDMEIIRDVSKSPRKLGIVERMVDFADEYNLRIIAEGIETEEDAEVIQAAGCHLMQGFFCGRPAALP